MSIIANTRAIILWLVALPILAQPEIELSPNPVRLGDEGIYVRFPIGSQAQSTQLGGRFVAQVIDDGRRWALTVRLATSANEALTALDVTSAAETQLKAAHGYADGQGRQQSLAESIMPTTGFTLSGAQAARFAIQAPSATGGEDHLQHYAAAAIGPGRFLTFDLRSTEPHAQIARAVFDAVLEGTDLGSVRASGVSRAVAVEAGIAWLKELSDDDLEQVLSSTGDVWMRLYKPATDAQPEQELGYQRLRAWRGSEADIKNPRPRRGGEGIVVQIIARTLQPGAQGIGTIDAESVSYVSRDLETEAWKVTLALREPGARRPSTWQSIGARTRTSMSVNIEDATRSVRTIRPQIEGEGYIPQPIALLLPRLLGVRSIDGSFGFYAFRSDAEAIVLRRDLVLPAGDATDDRIIETRLGPDRPVQRTRVTRTGEIRSIELPDGSRWEPTTLERLVALWRAKGLPID